MARRRYRSTTTYERSAGMERALQHIEDGKRLSRELGGTDADVKRYFFELPPSQFMSLLDAYEEKYGRSARSYAEKAVPKWKSGSVQMSGTVAERLFALLPPRMPLSNKLSLAKSLWEHVGPSSKKRMRIGTDSSVEEVISLASRHFEDAVQSYNIPDTMQRRFAWLAAGDVGVKQQLLNHMLVMERQLITEAVRLQFPVLLAHLQGAAGTFATSAVQVFNVGKHQLELTIDPAASGATLEEWHMPRRSVTARDREGWLTWVVLAVAGFLLYQCSAG